MFVCVPSINGRVSGILDECISCRRGRPNVRFAVVLNMLAHCWPTQTQTQTHAQTQTHTDTDTDTNTNTDTNPNTNTNTTHNTQHPNTQTQTRNRKLMCKHTSTQTSTQAHKQNPSTSAVRGWATRAGLKFWMPGEAGHEASHPVTYTF